MSDGTRTWTVVDLLKTASEYLREKNVAGARVDAELLLAHLFGGRRIDLYLQYDRPVAGTELGRYRELIRERASGRPVQRITGGAEFYSVTLRMREGVFIPRPETELLVDRGIAFLREEGGEAPFAVDAGTGSGAVAVALAKNAPRLRVEATDRSPEAVLCARENAKLAGVEERVDVIETDLAGGPGPRPGGGAPGRRGRPRHDPGARSRRRRRPPAGRASRDRGERRHGGEDRRPPR